MSRALLDFISAFANGAYSLANRIIALVNMPIDAIISSIDVDSVIIDSVIDLVADFLPDISLLQLMTGSVTFIISFILLKWFIDLVS